MELLKTQKTMNTLGVNCQALFSVLCGNSFTSLKNPRLSGPSSRWGTGDTYRTFQKLHDRKKLC